MLFVLIIFSALYSISKGYNMLITHLSHSEELAYFAFYVASVCFNCSVVVVFLSLFLAFDLLLDFLSHIMFRDIFSTTTQIKKYNTTDIVYP